MSTPRLAHSFILTNSLATLVSHVSSKVTPILIWLPMTCSLVPQNGAIV